VVRFFEFMLTQVGKYQIVEKIGVGGFGTVYKGRDPFIKRNVAIKTCQSDEEEIRKRFFREAELAGNLHHRNVTTIYDFGVTDDGTPYIVQEFLTGGDLDKVIKSRAPISLQRKIDILADVCDGLGYAHAAGIIHRDIKPSNIRILDDGTVKIMDFGIAKSMVSPSTLTQTGITLGTASYLAPEQILGEDLDARTDIFSLGVLAFELLTGQKPFTGDHISTVLYRIMNEIPPRASDVDPAIPRALEAVVGRALQKDRNLRYPTCAEMKSDLAASLRSDAVTSITSATAIQPVADSERTLATPTRGLSRPPPDPPPPSAASPARPLQTPAGAVAEVPLRNGETGPRPLPPPAPRRGPFRSIALGLGASLLVAVAGFLALRGTRPAGSPRPGPTAPAASPVPPTPEPTAVPSAAPSAAEPTVSVPTPVPPAPEVREPDAPVTVTFESNQPAQLVVGGKRYSGLPAPVRVSLRPGRYLAVFDLPDFQRKEERFEVKAGAAPPSVRVNFPPWGFLEISSDPPGAEVRIDGEAAGTTRLKKALAVGRHEVEVSFPGYETVRQEAQVRDGDLVRVVVPLRKSL
jgi:serine/threonine protein kinase